MTRTFFRAFPRAPPPTPQYIPGQHMELHYGRNLWRYCNLIIRNIISNLCNESHWQRRLIKHKLVNKGTADPVRY